MRTNVQTLKENILIATMRYGATNLVDAPLPCELRTIFYEETVDVPQEPMSAEKGVEAFIDMMSDFLFGKDAEKKVAPPTDGVPGRKYFEFTLHVPIYAGGVFHEALRRTHAATSQSMVAAQYKFDTEAMFSDNRIFQLIGCFIKAAPYLTTEAGPYCLVVPLSVDQYLDPDNAMTRKMNPVHDKSGQ